MFDSFIGKVFERFLWLLLAISLMGMLVCGFTASWKAFQASRLFAEGAKPPAEGPRPWGERGTP